MKWLQNNPYQNWAETRKTGRWKYAYSHGITFGFLIFISNIFFIQPNSRVGLWALILFLLFSIGMGILGYYVLMWWVQERIYNQKTESKN